MNHLAHALVAHRTETSIVGNLMGDFVKGAVGAEFAPEYRIGILLHRRVDAYTDDHAAFARSRDLLRPELGRWAGVVVDVLWDHVLAREWERYTAEPFRDFTARVGEELAAAGATGVLPGRMPRFVEYLVSSDLLYSYREAAGIRSALTGLSMRIRRENPLADAADLLPATLPALTEDFESFFPDLLAAVAPGED